MSLDLDAFFGQDIKISSGSDISLIGDDANVVSGKAELIQRVVRRLLTNPGEWLPFPNYGGGLRRYVDAKLTTSLLLRIKADILTQLSLEPDIVKSPPPTVDISTISGGIEVYISFYFTGQRFVSFNFNPEVPNIITITS